jgi:5'-nucleotidase
MQKMLRTSLVAVVLALPCVAVAAHTLNVLVTNDDGVGAPGIDALVTALAADPHLAVTVIAPATNQSGTGDRITTAPATITAEASSTAGAFPATAVAGFPADSVLYGVLEALPARPDLVVSGINDGQNIADFVAVSGTVGAARWAARLGIPAFAVSAQLGTTDFSVAAEFTAKLVDRFRRSKGFQRRMVEKAPPHHGLVLNLNFPSCPSGPRDLLLVSLARSTMPTGYELLSDVGGVATFRLTATTGNAFVVDCASTTGDPVTDLAAFTSNFATVTPLTAEGAVSSTALRKLRFVAKQF